MPSQTENRPKAAQLRTKQKGRRLPPKVKSRPDIPLLPVVVGAILVAVAIGLIGYYWYSNNAGKSVQAAGIPCDELERSQVHYHAALQIVYNDILTPIPANIGITGDTAAPTCYYWLHVHGANPDVIHIESPRDRSFTLADFFTVWNAWSKAKGGPSEPLDSTHVSTFTLTPDQKLVVYIDLGDGKGAQVFTGDPRTISLKAHEVITLEITSGTPSPPPSFDWTSTANNGL